MARSSVTYRVGAGLLLRATSCPQPELDGWVWPDFNGSADFAGAVRCWMECVWSDSILVDGVTHASSDLAAEIEEILHSPETPSDRRVRSAALSLLRYLLRWYGRSNPFGLFAGVAVGTFSESAVWRWRGDHKVVARAASGWIDEVVTLLEAVPELLARLPVIANSAAFIRAGRLIVPYRPGVEGPVDVSFAYTEPVRFAMCRASEPIVFGDLAACLEAEFTVEPERAASLLTGLVGRGALISALRAPLTEPDALGHVLEVLGRAGSTDVPAAVPLSVELRAIHTALEACGRTPVPKVGPELRAADAMMRAITAAGATVTVDLRLGADVALPHLVGQEIARAAEALVRMSPLPFGTRAWREYVERFWNRFGTGALIPLPDVVAELGFPHGYLGVSPWPRPTVSDRDQLLVELAQTAALDGADEIVVDDDLLTRLGPGVEIVPPPHLDVGFRLHAPSLAKIDAGRFRAEITTLARGGGVLTGRYLPVLSAADRALHAADLTGLPASDACSVVAQVSFPPLRPGSGDVVRTGQILPTLISLGEYRPPSPGVLTVSDLAVGCDGRGLYLAAPERGIRVDAVQMHALNKRLHTPPLARLLIEVTRSQHTHVFKGTAWGAAAERLPFRPALRRGKVVLSPASWRVDRRSLPAPAKAQSAWDREFETLRERRRIPRRVHLVEGDRLLPLDLDEPSHRVLLRAGLNRSGSAALSKAPDPSALGWCDGRAHELITTLSGVRPRRVTAPDPTPARVVRRGHGDAPGTSDLLFAKLECPPEHQDEVLAERLPPLLDLLDRPEWWLLRYTDDKGAHLRLRFSLSGNAGKAERFGRSCQAITGWAQRLQSDGLAGPVSYETSFPELGRWGSGDLYRLATAVFRTDSEAVLDQLRLPVQFPHAVLAAVNMASIAYAFNGGVEPGMRWLTALPPQSAVVARPLLKQAVMLADPTGGWVALRALPAGALLASSWTRRDAALAAYRDGLASRCDEAAGIDQDQVMKSLLHVYYVRARGTDRQGESAALHLARAAAQAWTAKNQAKRG